MSILVLVRNYPALSETFVRRQAERLSAAVMCEKFDADTYSKLNLTGQVHEIGERGVAFESYCRARSIFGLLPDVWSPAQRLSANRILRRIRPGAVLAHYGPNAIKIAPACRNVGVRLFVHFHGYDASALVQHPSYRAAISKVLRDCAGAVVVSDPMADSIRKLGIEESKLAVIPCGVDVSMFSEDLRRNGRKCTFLMVGRLVEKKSPLSTVKAFEICADRVPDCELRMVGFGPLRDEVENYVEASRHRLKIKMLGSKDFDEVKKELENADIFVQHSVTASDGNTEGWPISIAEAAAAGLPIVSTQHAGIPMQVVDGETGFLVAEGDIEAMAQKMEQLARDGAVRVEMGAASRRHIERVGSIEDSVSYLRKFIESRL